MVQVRDIIETDIKRIDANDILSSAIGALTSEGSVLVYDNGFAGIITTRKLIRTRLNPSETKVRGLIINPPLIEEDTELIEVARLMVESDLVTIPVRSGNDIKGVVRAREVLAVLGQELELDIVARHIMSQPVKTIGQDALLSTAANIMQRKGISRIPVVENDEILGLISTTDIIANMLNHNKADIFLLDEHLELQNVPVKNAMDTSFATEHPDTPISALCERITNAVTTILITETGYPEGIITQRDILEAYLFTQEREQTISIGITLKDDMDQTPIREELEAFVSKYTSQLGEGTIRATLEKHHEKHRGQEHITAKLRILTDNVGISAIGDGWGQRHAIKDALRKAEKQMLR